MAECYYTVLPSARESLIAIEQVNAEVWRTELLTRRVIHYTSKRNEGIGEPSEDVIQALLEGTGDRIVS